jgi:hypothetical protein
MRRVVLLAILALALPTVAVATTVDYAGFAGPTDPATLTGTVATGDNFALTFSSLSINGGAFGPGTMTFSINVGASCGAGCFDIGSGSTVTVWNASKSVLFMGTFNTGATDIVSFNGTSLGIMGTTEQGIAFAGVLKFSGACPVGESAVSCWTGSSDIQSTVPEPGTLGLLGTGLVGLAGMVRRKLIG